MTIFVPFTQESLIFFCLIVIYHKKAQSKCVSVLVAVKTAQDGIVKNTDPNSGSAMPYVCLACGKKFNERGVKVHRIGIVNT